MGRQFLNIRHSSTITSRLSPAVEAASSNEFNQGTWKLTFNQLDQPGIQMKSETYASLLRECRNLKDGKRIHEHIVYEGLGKNVYLESLILHMYMKCGALEDAIEWFANMSDRNVFSWNFLIQAYARQGHGQEPFQLFDRMQQEAVMPNKITFLSILDAYASQPVQIDGDRIHARIMDCGFGSDLLCGTALINMYGKSGRLNDSCKIFDQMADRDVVTWTAMITVFAQHGQGRKALQLLDQMQAEGVQPSKITFVSILAALAKHAALAEGKEVHARILTNGFESEVIVGNALVNMYGKCGKLEEARAMFDKLPLRNVVSFTSMIALYTQNRYGKAALLLFDQMQCEGIVPNKVTFVNLLGACASMTVLAEGRRMHTRMLDRDFASDVIVGTALLNMYGKCSSLVDAQTVFDTFSEQDLVLWNAMIAAYVQNGQGKDAIRLFENMQQKQIGADRVTLVSILAAYATCSEQIEGGWMHAYILESGLEVEVVVGNALLYMYGQWGKLEDARVIFDKMPYRDVVSWTVMIAGYTLHDQGKEVLQLLNQMQQEGILPDKVTYVSILDASASHPALTDYQQIHARIMKSALYLDINLVNALVKMYGKCGSLQDAQRLFEMMSERDVVSWNGMIAICAQYGHGKDALGLFDQMLGEEIKPNRVTFITMLSVCASQILLSKGKEIHVCIVESGWELDVIVGTALLTMYGKCGSLDDAKWTFDKMSEQNVYSWNAVIAVYAQHGHGKEVVQLFLRMQQERVTPDAITFASVLAACSHTGLIDDGLKFFASMMHDHGILPDPDHYVCMIDLLGRAGQLDEAENLIHSMSDRPTATPFMAMLGACRSRHDAKRGERVANQIFELDPENSAPYIMLSNIFAAVGKEDDIAKEII